MHNHRLIHGIEHALGWSGPSALGTQFTRGTLPNPGLVSRLLTPRRLLDVLMRRSLSPAGVDVAKLADVLIEEGLCAEVTDELLSGYTGLMLNDDYWKLP